MANSKSIRRFRVLNRCFRDPSRDYTLLDLLDEVNRDQSDLANPHPVGERQIYADIAYMRSADGFNADIDTYKVVRPDDKGRNRSYMAYRYHDQSYSIENAPLTDSQLAYVKSALDSLHLIKGIPQVEWLRQSYTGVQHYFDEFSLKQPCVQFGGNPYLGGHRVEDIYKFFEQLFTAYTNHQSLEMEYCCFVYGECHYHVHPIYFKQFRGFWYVFGVTTEQPDQIRPWALDRIKSLKPCGDPYIRVDFDPETYFEDFIGVVKPDTGVEDIHLQFYGWAANYVENSPLHGSQRSKWIEVDGQQVLDVWLRIMVNKEFIGALQYYVDTVKVISPEELRQRHIQSIRSGMALNGVE